MCQACIENLRRNAKLLSSAPSGRRAQGPWPTAAELERHARRFGPEGVEELANELGVRIKVERPKVTRTRAKGPTLKQRVAEHLAEGRGVELIAELENLSPSRARRLVEEVSA